MSLFPETARLRAIALFIAATLLSHPVAASTSNSTSSDNGSAIEWQSFGPAAFEQARRENKLVLLDLVAVWCHWCHVMEAKTYSDPDVVAYIEEHFVPVQADHDARPDLAERYRKWGWPATVVLDASGTDVVKRAGYIAPEPMLRLMAAVRADPSPERRDAEPEVRHAGDFRLSDRVAEELERRHERAHDTRLGGLDMVMKFLDLDTVLLSLDRLERGVPGERERIIQGLDANLALIDPEFGGVYQYSTHGDWEHPHYEKIMKSQWANLVAYSRACTALDMPRYCNAGRRIADYLFEFLSDPEGGFYTSQDADLVQGRKAHDYFAASRAERLAQGLPRIDKNLYASTNGMAIEGLAELYRATGEQRYLDRAIKAATWTIAQRRLWGGGFRHAQRDAAGPYLADTLWMGRAFLALYRATGDDKWLAGSSRAAEFISKYLRHEPAGLAASANDGTPVQPKPQIDQNIQAALWLAGLQAITGDESQRDLARHVMAYLAAPERALARFTEAGILLADRLLRDVESETQQLSALR